MFCSITGISSLTFQKGPTADPHTLKKWGKPLMQNLARPKEHTPHHRQLLPDEIHELMKKILQYHHEDEQEFGELFTPGAGDKGKLAATSILDTLASLSLRFYQPAHVLSSLLTHILGLTEKSSLEKMWQSCPCRTKAGNRKISFLQSLLQPLQRWIIKNSWDFSLALPKWKLFTQSGY